MDVGREPSDAGGHPDRLFVEGVQAVTRDVALSAGIPGISLAVATPVGALYSGAYGFADLADRRRALPQDQYPWFSMSKIATATAAMRLHAEGILDLDQPIGNYVRGYRGHARNGHPTTRQLLTHTAGLGNPLPVRWVRPEGVALDPDWLRRIVARYGTPQKQVGRRAAYSNIGYLLAGEVITAATGRPLQECVQDLVLKPLQMAATGYSYAVNAPRAVGYVRLASALRPALAGALPRGIVGPPAGRYTSLRPFLVNGAAYGGLVGNAADAYRLAAMHAASARSS